ncbi:uracil-xanthine permease family protein [Microbacterium sp. gxy059]|uniref:uracil-xanthine permease family protein n=1 Tax=Microbacterium sp. gxy059 TaxID=2957199 RepID=UPI003D99E9C5
MPAAPPTRTTFAIGFDDPVAPHRSAVYGLQHLLALTGLWVFPTSLGAAVGLATEDVAKIIQGCFLLTGLVTILSSSRILRLPIVQGPTAALLVALITTGGAYGIDVAFGSMVVAGALSLILAFPLFKLGVYGHVAKFIANPLVFGTMFLVLGAQLASVGVSGWFQAMGDHGVWASVVVAVVAATAVAACMIFGGRTIVKRMAILIGVVAGTLTAAALGAWTLPDLSAFSFVGLPEFAPFGLGFAWGAVPIMMVGFLQAAGESMGVYALLGKWSGQRIDVNRANRGLFVEFLGSAVGGLFGGIGSTSYPENSGILRVSGVASRRVTIAAGIFAVVLAFLPQFALFIASLPGPALSAAATILFGVITFAGVQQLGNVRWDDLNLVVAAVCFIVPVGLQAMPAEIVAQMSPTISGIITSPMMMSTVMLIVLHPLVNLVIRPLLGRRQPDAELDLEEPAA